MEVTLRAYRLRITAKKRQKEAAKDGDNRLSKKARKLAESSLGPKNSILRHMQPGMPGAASRAPAAKKGEFGAIRNLCQALQPLSMSVAYVYFSCLAKLAVWF
jgi:hypothetical protein